MSKIKNVNTPATAAVAPQNAFEAMFTDLMTEGVSVRRVLAVGSYDTIFKGIEFDIAKFTVTIKFESEGNEYLDVKNFKGSETLNKTKEEWDKTMFKIRIPMEQIARQFEFQGQVTPAMINAHIGEPLKVWAFIPEGRKAVAYNYAEPYVAPKVTTTSAGPVDGKDF